MKRKMLISIALIIIMLLNCIMPLVVVNADVSSGEAIQLNSKLYKAIKTNLYKEGIVFESDDITHTITISAEEKAKVVRLDLNESAISDLSGIEAFSSLTHLELSGNNLSKKSNLGVLNSLTALNYLDLSTNQLDEVDDIYGLISRLQKEGTIILSGQTVTQVHTVYVDSEEESDQVATASFELPGILELAGYLKAVWKDQKRYAESVTPYESNWGTPSIENTPMYVTADDKLVEVTIADKNSGAGYYGMVKFTIYIYDDPTEAAQANNTNRASENILNGSRFFLYYVVHDSSTEAITTMDTNLYKAIKEQLTAGQEVNPELASYPYKVDKDGNIIYEEFAYYTATTDEGIAYKVLYDVKTNEIKYAMSEAGDLYECDGSYIGDYVETLVEPIEIKTVDENGVVTIQAGYKVAFIGDNNGITLYDAAYDEAKTFVINDVDLTNKITSLILNNKQIRDLSGIEKFVGLNSELNVSHNYLSNIDPIYKLQEHKDAWEAQMIETFRYWLSERQYGNLTKSTSLVTAAQNSIENEIENIENTQNLIFNTLVDASKLDPSAENYDEEIKGKVDAIDAHLKAIYGYTEASGDHVDGYLDNIDNYLNDPEYGLNPELFSMYGYLSRLYNIYNNEYKLTTFLADDVNYMTYAEYETYKNATESSRDAAFELLESQISYVIALEANNALSELDVKMLEYCFGINFNDPEVEHPVAEYFNKLLEKNAMSRTDIVYLLETFREIGLYSEMANYCLIQRMNNETAIGYCYEKEYLEKRIEELELEEIPSDLEKEVLEKIERYEAEGVFMSEYPWELHQVYMLYSESTYTYGNEENSVLIAMCFGEYKEVEEIIDSYVVYTDEEAYNKVLELVNETAEEPAEGEEVIVNMGAVTTILSKISKSIIKEVNLAEVVEYIEGPKDELHVYDQLLSLANKLIHGNVERYVKLPDLKKLDVSYNADLDNLEGITVLQSLYDLNAAYCYIADITNVNWSEMVNLRRLNLAYNYISDISPITELTTLKSLNLSNNLITGKLEISEYQYEKLFKKLEELNLSGNKIDDITSLLIYLDHVTNGDYANYIAKENTIDINLNNQKLTMEIEKPINLKEYPTTIDVELPKIFTQLLAIDVERTAFGENSQEGRVESEGTYVTLNTRTEGDKVGEVVVIPMSGNGTEVDTCVGAGTKLTIKYKVVNEKVTGVTVTPNEDVIVKPGETLQFTATVEGENLLSTKVEWTVVGAQNEETTISETGLLTVGAEETAEKLEVIATSEADKNIMTTIEVATVEEVVDPENPDNTDPENPGTTPENPDNTESENPGTTPENPDNTESENPGTTPENPDNTEPEQPEVDVIDTATLGYEAGEEYLTGIQTKTPVQDFKSILLNGKEYNVIVKKENENGEKEIVTSGYITTGMFVEVQDEEGNTIKDENGHLVVYEIVVKGDVNGDGVANSLDSTLIKAYKNEVTDLSGSAKIAADINEDGKVNVFDVKALLYHRAEVTGYTLDYKK